MSTELSGGAAGTIFDGLLDTKGGVGDSSHANTGYRTIENPEFQIPFNFTDDGASELEQGSPEEIQQCIFAIFCFEPGDLTDFPDLGLAAQTFQKGGVNVDLIRQAIDRFGPPDASETIDRDPNWIQTLLETITIRRDTSNGG